MDDASAALIVQLQMEQNENEEAFEAPAFGWKLKQADGHLEVSIPSPRD